MFSNLCFSPCALERGERAWEVTGSNSRGKKGFFPDLINFFSLRGETKRAQFVIIVVIFRAAVAGRRGWADEVHGAATYSVHAMRCLRIIRGCVPDPRSGASDALRFWGSGTARGRSHQPNLTIRRNDVRDYWA